MRHDGQLKGIYAINATQHELKGPGSIFYGGQDNEKVLSDEKSDALYLRLDNSQIVESIAFLIQKI